MGKLNCWEFKKCGREHYGAKEKELGICPANTDKSCDGMNSGMNAGRICWAVTGTLCGGVVQGTDAQKRMSCMTCEFFKLVRSEESAATFSMSANIQSV